MLDQLGDWGLRKNVAILIGPNGSGKSRFLREIARESRKSRDTVVVCNTAFDRFSGIRGIEKLSAGRGGGQSPRSAVKSSVGRALVGRDSRYYQAGAILEYCGYYPRFGFRVVGASPGRSLDRLGGSEEYNDEMRIALDYIHLFGHEITWVDQYDLSMDGFKAQDFGAVLRQEDVLRRSRHIRDILVYLHHRQRGIVELRDASSGELSLISSLVFLVGVPYRAPIILIDEPENSLHPTWQREYIDKLLAATTYRDAQIVIATHAPLIVTGALALHARLVSVFQLQNGEPRILDLTDGASSSEGIEELLYRAFDVITPANHFISLSMQEMLSRLERGEIDQDGALSIVEKMTAQSFDSRQVQFFNGVRKMVENFAKPFYEDGNNDD